MGVHENINPLRGRFPRQSENVTRRVVVCFDYDTSRTVGGVIVRDDLDAPGELLIQLDDGPIVRAVECQYSYARD